MPSNTIQRRNEKVWIDLDNSPHVLFFSPIVKELEKRGIPVTITVRNFSHVVDLAILHGLTFRTVGRHYGKNKVKKVWGTLVRSIQLLHFRLKEKPALAISHGSRSQLIAAKLSKIPVMEIYDYEYATAIPFFIPDYTLVPEPLYNKLKKDNIAGLSGYPGIKEDVYVHELKPDPSILQTLGIKSNEVVVTVRPPATVAHYFTSRSAELFYNCMDYIFSRPNVRVIMLPRIHEQKEEIISRWPAAFHNRQMIIPEHVVDGLNLIWHSDLVISGGGTMIREAAALNVPAYSIYGGKICAVDSYLNKTKRLTLIDRAFDYKNRLLFQHRRKNSDSIISQRASLDFIVTKIESALGLSGCENS